VEETREERNGNLDETRVTTSVVEEMRAAGSVVEKEEREATWEGDGGCL
jgi:hypothetical protein